MKNLLNLIRKQRRKPIIYWCFARGKKPPKLSKKNEKENKMLIEDRDKEPGTSGSKI